MALLPLNGFIKFKLTPEQEKLSKDCLKSFLDTKKYIFTLFSTQANFKPKKLTTEKKYLLIYNCIIQCLMSYHVKQVEEIIDHEIEQLGEKLEQYKTTPLETLNTKNGLVIKMNGMSELLDIYFDPRFKNSEKPSLEEAFKLIISSYKDLTEQISNELVSFEQQRKELETEANIFELINTYLKAGIPFTENVEEALQDEDDIGEDFIKNLIAQQLDINNNSENKISNDKNESFLFTKIQPFLGSVNLEDFYVQVYDNYQTILKMYFDNYQYLFDNTLKFDEDSMSKFFETEVDDVDEFYDNVKLKLRNLKEKFFNVDSKVQINWKYNMTMEEKLKDIFTKLIKFQKESIKENKIEKVNQIKEGEID